jgi:hypothetical protein
MTIWGWLEELNSGDGFAGYTDWRIPTLHMEGNMPELETILAPPCVAGTPCVPLEFDSKCLSDDTCNEGWRCQAGQSCVTVPWREPDAPGRCQEVPGCTSTSCSCTSFLPYWSATSDVSTSAARPSAWVMAFDSHEVYSIYKTSGDYRVRAVRGEKPAGANDCCQCPSSCAAPVDGSCGDCTTVFDAGCLGEQTCVPHTPASTLPPTPTPTPCRKDNGDGTITDGCTGLMWEKKDQAGSLHDRGMRYTWAGACSDNSMLCQPNAEASSLCSAQTGGAVGCDQCAGARCVVDPVGQGVDTTIWDWLRQLNEEGFAGHTDWRIPTVGFHGTAAELETIFADPNSCAWPTCVQPEFNINCSLSTDGCSVMSCSCTAFDDAYWSTTSNLTESGMACAAFFFSGGVGCGFPKTNALYVRAVRHDQ